MSIALSILTIAGIGITASGATPGEQSSMSDDLRGQIVNGSELELQRLHDEHLKVSHTDTTMLTLTNGGCPMPTEII